VLPCPHPARAATRSTAHAIGYRGGGLMAKAFAAKENPKVWLTPTCVRGIVHEKFPPVGSGCSIRKFR